MTRRLQALRKQTDEGSSDRESLLALRSSEADTEALSTGRFEIPRDPWLDATVNTVRRGKLLADPTFDAIYPDRIRSISAMYWTPISVARRAAQILAVDPSTRVLDVGSGAGKFCTIGALVTGATFTGIEQRRDLVDLSRSIAEHYGIQRAVFVHGDIRDVDWSQFDAFYFFNPFGENYFGAGDRIDDSVELTPERFERDVTLVLDALSRAAVGTRVVTYHGLGRDLPECYVRSSCELAGSDVLELWQKTESGPKPRNARGEHRQSEASRTR